MFISKYKTFFIKNISSYRNIISICLCTLYFIFDSCSVFLHIYRCKFCCPVVLCIQSHFVFCCFSVCIKFCFYRVKTCSILIFCVIPFYRYRNLNSCRNISVFYNKASCCISAYRSLIRFRKSGNLCCVNDRFADFSSSVLLQTGPCLGEITCTLKNNLITNFYVVCKKLYIVRSRTNIILIVLVIPFSC